jgi:hypothetical protein
MKYGFSRDFIINKIMEGYNASFLDTEDETKEELIDKKHLLCEIPIHKIWPVKERLIILSKNDIIYPLFVDVNHHLFSDSRLEYKTNHSLQDFFKSKLGI